MSKDERRPLLTIDTQPSDELVTQTINIPDDWTTGFTLDQKKTYNMLKDTPSEIAKFNSMVKDVEKGKQIFQAYIASKSTIKTMNGRTEKDFRFLSTEYDSAFRAIETIDSFTAALAVGTATTLVGAPIALPIACVCILSRCMTFIGGKYMKNRELSYLCSACFGYIFNIMNNVKSMLEFYDVLEDMKDNNFGISKNPVTWNVVQENLYKFLFYLIEQVDFSLENLGEKQYPFFNALFMRMDFSRNGKSKSPMVIFKYSTPDCAPDNAPIENSSGIINWAKTQISKRLKPSTHMLLKAIAHNNVLCTNYNDIIIRFLELKIKTLLQNPKIKRKIAELPENANVELPTDFEKNFFIRLKDFEQEIGSDTVVSLSGGGRKTKARSLPSNRITKKFSHFNEMQMGGGPFNKIGGFFKEIYAATFKPVNQLYREMLREYVIMTGNFSLLISDYLVHYNKYTLEHSNYKEKRDAHSKKNKETEALLKDFEDKMSKMDATSTIDA